MAVSAATAGLIFSCDKILDLPGFPEATLMALIRGRFAFMAFQVLRLNLQSHKWQLAQEQPEKSGKTDQ
jgi:hypothetical protein